MEYVQNAIDSYNYLVDEYGDPRVKDWVTVRSPVIPFTTIIIYLLIIYKILPKFMKNREAFKLRGLLIVYNTILSLSSIYIFIQLCRNMWYSWSRLYCLPPDFSATPANETILNLTWLFYLSKYVELLDTVFFVVRKNQHQVTFLHVFHHSIMIFNLWLFLKVCGVSHTSFIGFTNSFVHFFMYGYYGLSAMGPRMKKYLFWKKYMTKLQITQFVLNIFHALQVFYNGCDVPLILTYNVLIQCSIFIALFSNFYIQAYLNRKRQSPVMNGHSQKNGNGIHANVNGVHNQSYNLRSQNLSPKANSIMNESSPNGKLRKRS